MNPGDLVRVHLYGKWHDEIAVIIAIKKFKKDSQCACQILWRGKSKWIHGSKLALVEVKDAPEVG